MAARRDSGLFNRAFAATVFIAFFVLFAIAALFLLGRWTRTSPEPEIVVKSIGPTITQLQSLGELVVLRVSVADVLEAMGQGYKGAWLVKGDALLSVDLRVAEFTLTDHENRRLVIALPVPTVIQPRVDQEKNKNMGGVENDLDSLERRSRQASRSNDAPGTEAGCVRMFQRRHCATCKIQHLPSADSYVSIH